MTKQKKFKVLSLFVLTFVATFMLGIVGVFALQESLTTKLNAVFSPDIYCKVEMKNSSSNWETIFDNKHYANFDYVNPDYCTVENNVLNIEQTLSGQVATTIEFRVTNYSNAKNISATLENITVNNSNSENVTYSANTVICEKFDSEPTTNSDLKLFLSTIDNYAQKVNIKLKLQEVFKVEFSDSNNKLTNETIYIPDNQDATITLTAVEGSEFPASITSTYQNTINENTSQNATFEATYARGTSTITIPKAAITDDITITCNTKTIYTIKEYADELAPTNGKTGSDFRIYKYYVEMGEFPQTYVGNSLNETLETAYKNSSLGAKLKTYSQRQIDFNGYTVGSNESNILVEDTTDTDTDNTELTNSDVEYYKYEVDGQVYARSHAIKDVYSNNVTTPRFSDGSVMSVKAKKQSQTIIDDEGFETTVDVITGYYAKPYWFKVEPIRWTVIGVGQSDTTYNLDNLYYGNNCLYTDKALTKKYTGGLLLLSELALETSQFSTGYTYFGEQTASAANDSVLFNMLNRTDTNTFAQVSGLASYFVNSSESNSTNYIKYENLTTYGSYTDGTIQNYHSYANLFVLASGSDSNLEGNFANQSYYAPNYFNSVQKSLGSTVPAGFRNSVGANIPSDFCLANSPYINGSSSYIRNWGGNDLYYTLTGTDEQQKINYYYSVANYGITAHMRTGSSSSNTMNYVQLFFPGFQADVSKNSYNAVRPCFVLDMGYKAS